MSVLPNNCCGSQIGIAQSKIPPILASNARIVFFVSINSPVLCPIITTIYNAMIIVRACSKIKPSIAIEKPEWFAPIIAVVFAPIKIKLRTATGSAKNKIKLRWFLDLENVEIITISAAA